MTSLRIVGSGVDSLYFSVRGQLRDGVREALVALRSNAGDQPALLELADEEGAFLLRPHGWRGYPFWLTSPRFELFLGAAAPFPPAYIELHSAFLHTVGVEAAVAEAETTLRVHLTAGPIASTPSRIDLYADEQGWTPQAADFERFSCRGVRRRLFEQPRELHAVGRQPSGFTFGKGEIVARIYDKTLEMRSRGQTWPELLWPERDVTSPVWRVEFQLRRKALVTFGIRSMDQLLSTRQSLWTYGTNWLSLRTPGGHAKRSRWDEAPEWAALREAQIGSSHSALVRERIRNATLLQLIRGFIGYASSLGALGYGHDLERAVGRVAPLIGEYLAGRSTTFSDIVARKRDELRARQLPSPRPSSRL